MNCSMFLAIDEKWGPHTIDQMATGHNTQLPHYHSHFFKLGSATTNCLMQDWLVQAQGATATIITPMWSGCLWHQDLKDLMINTLIPLHALEEMFLSKHRTPEPLHNH
ncbi:uncharacterized protein ACA1_322360 [Acanthamoeba castellanii str. Neff]|uniref:Uncharacterized protein n=1 Tax=Acanthamoeba castellanii (strain ATCC 30010 / Neff) TaxID=1257118 RepID=L8HG37_ACACF|nr:uncharacterized protein ACA1_322360 [Acanthamoeba castellanii str. Neff]ELR24499.1 hypothetical protein ACA1_322360 [Acanthamoeba castellanii str. Neff]